MLVFDSTGPMETPAHFVLIDWSGSRIIKIRDFLFAPYVLEAIDWVRLGSTWYEIGVSLLEKRPDPFETFMCVQDTLLSAALRA